MEMPLSSLADFELRHMLADADKDRRYAADAELAERTRLRASMRGHDPALCCHPLWCGALAEVTPRWTDNTDAL